jgi:hypothetical protein
MRDLEAKDFLVQQTAEQAAMENIPLSDLEKRMMYFTETGEMRENAIELNDAFEAEYDTEEYEGKISKLLRHARARAKKENPETACLWDDSIRVLRKGDHYLWVLWNQESSNERPPYDSLKLLGTAFLVIIVGGAAMFGLIAFADHFNIHWKTGPSTHTSVPVWIQRLLIALMVGGYIYYVVLPWLLKRPPVGIGQLFVKLLGTLLKNRTNK